MFVTSSFAFTGCRGQSAHFVTNLILAQSVITVISLLINFTLIASPSLHVADFREMKIVADFLKWRTYVREL